MADKGCLFFLEIHALHTGVVSCSGDAFTCCRRLRDLEDDGPDAGRGEYMRGYTVLPESGDVPGHTLQLQG